MMISSTQIAISAIVITLASNCARNMIQTSQIAGRDETVTDIRRLLPPDCCGSTASTVEHLKTLERKDLIELFCACEEPVDTEDFIGEWNGALLENNGPVMTLIGSRFMTNVLFSMGRRWNGKIIGDKGSGANRFISKKEIGATDREHSFDYKIEQSMIQPRKKSFKLIYSNYQFPLSLWKTMVDEVRRVPGDNDVLIGLGSMAWSGGMLNAAPFCLWRESRKTKSD